MKPWTAEWPWSIEQAEAEIVGQLPHLKGRRVSHLGEGWDCAVFRVDASEGALAFRFPRRPLGLVCLENELRVVPQLPALGLVIPRPEWVGQARGRPFFGHRMVPGVSADKLGLSEAERASLALPLARFLGRLHGCPRPEGSTDDPFRGDPPRVWWRLRDKGIQEELLKPTSERWLCHGDLYARHLTIEEGRLVGVLDWGDVCWADRAVDLSIVYAFLPPDARPTFFEDYGAIDAATAARSRFYARYYGYVLAEFAADIQDQTLLAEAHVITDLSRR